MMKIKTTVRSFFDSIILLISLLAFFISTLRSTSLIFSPSVLTYHILNSTRILMQHLHGNYLKTNLRYCPSTSLTCTLCTVSVTLQNLMTFNFQLLRVLPSQVLPKNTLLANTSTQWEALSLL